MSFPATPLTALVEIALGADVTAAPGTWSWTDVTDFIYTRDRIQITRGRPDWTATADTSALSMTADNRDGRWSTRNPSGAWFGQIRIGTPVRVSAEGHVRFTGFLSALPPRWDVSGFDRHAPLAAKGLLYRLGRGASPAQSAMRRTILAAAPQAYWPLEDGPDATQAASGITSGEPLRPIGSILFGVGLTAAGSLLSCTAVEGGTLSGPTGIAPGAVASWEAEVAVGWDVMPALGVKPYIVGFDTPGSAIAQWGISLDDDGVTQRLAIYRVTTTGTTTIGSSSGFPVEAGTVYHFRIRMEQSGGDVNYARFIDGNANGTGVEAGVTLTAPTQALINPRGEAASQPDAVCQVAIWTPARASPSTFAAAPAYAGEEAHTRVSRLCEEDGVLASSAATQSQPMGPQAAKTFLELVRECEASDQAYLYEGLDFGLVLQSHAERENLAAALELDYEVSGHVSPPLEPTDDDQQARNDVEVKRDGGSSARLTEEDPGVELSIPNIGRRDESVTLALADDSQPAVIAGRRLFVGTYPGYRYPQLTLNLAAGPSLIDDACAADLAFRATVDNPPDDIGPDPVSVMVEGYTEALEPFGWEISANCSIAGPWQVGLMADTVGDTDPLLGFSEWDACVTAEALDTTETGVDITATPLTSTASDDFPLDIYIGGERMTVSACVGASNPQTLTVARSVNGVVKSHAAGAPVTMANPLVMTQ